FRSDRRLPGAAQVAQPRLDAFHIEMNRAAAGKGKFDRAGRRLPRHEAQGEKRQHFLGLGHVDPGRPDGENAVEIDRGEPPLVLLSAEEAGLLLFPGEAPHHHGEALLALLVTEFARLHHRVLNMRGDDAQVLLIERGKLQEIHTHLTRYRRYAPAAQPEIRSISAPQPESFSSSRSKPRSRW